MRDTLKTQTISHPIGLHDADRFIAECVREQTLHVEITTIPAVQFVYKLEKMIVGRKETKFE